MDANQIIGLKLAVKDLWDHVDTKSINVNQPASTQEIINVYNCLLLDEQETYRNLDDQLKVLTEKGIMYTIVDISLPPFIQPDGWLENMIYLTVPSVEIYSTNTWVKNCECPGEPILHNQFEFCPLCGRHRLRLKNVSVGGANMTQDEFKRRFQELLNCPLLFMKGQFGLWELSTDIIRTDNAVRECEVVVDNPQPSKKVVVLNGKTLFLGIGLGVGLGFLVGTCFKNGILDAVQKNERLLRHIVCWGRDIPDSILKKPNYI